MAPSVVGYSPLNRRVAFGRFLSLSERNLPGRSPPGEFGAVAAAVESGKEDENSEQAENEQDAEGDRKNVLAAVVGVAALGREQIGEAGFAGRCR